MVSRPSNFDKLLLNNFTVIVGLLLFRNRATLHRQVISGPTKQERQSEDIKGRDVNYLLHAFNGSTWSICPMINLKLWSFTTSPCEWLRVPFAELLSFVHVVTLNTFLLSWTRSQSWSNTGLSLLTALSLGTCKNTHCPQLVTYKYFHLYSVLKPCCWPRTHRK